MPLLLVVAFVVVPIVELYVLIQVGQAIGVVPTLALLVLDSVLGAALVRREGRRTWAAFRDATAQGRVPAREVADGALVVFGGALLLTPGFTTDVLGLLCVLPPTRRVLRRYVTGAAARRLATAAGVGAGPGRKRRRRAAPRPPAGTTAGPASPPPASGSRVVEGEVVDDP